MGTAVSTVVSKKRKSGEPDKKLIFGNAENIRLEATRELGPTTSQSSRFSGAPPTVSGLEPKDALVSTGSVKCSDIALRYSHPLRWPASWWNVIELRCR